MYNHDKYDVFEILTILLGKKFMENIIKKYALLNILTNDYADNDNDNYFFVKAENINNYK